MQEFPRKGPTSDHGAPASRLFATFKLATPWVVEIVHKSDVAAQPRKAANINMPGIVAKETRPS